jgi:hypothetical protein
MILFGDHANTIALSQTAEKVLLSPRELKTLSLNLQNFCHITPNQPADLDL